MLNRAAGGILAAVLLAGLVAPAAPRAAPARCAPSSARIVAQDAAIQAYHDTRRHGYFFCQRATGQRIAIDHPSDEVGSNVLPGTVAVAGDRVAYAIDDWSADNEDAPSTRIFVRDAVHYTGVAEFADPADPEFGSKVTRLILRADGAVAWAACRTADIGPDLQTRHPRCRHAGIPAWIYVRQAGAQQAQLVDRGRRIVTRSLKRSGTHVSWQHGSRRRSAQLP
jgi:hypothetical protein